jgi:hypothetical protein
MFKEGFILVTGSGRCGTGYMAKAFEAASGLAFGHEAVFTNCGLMANRAEMYQGDASWLAAPYFPQIEGSSVTVVHLVRHPLLVIGSLRGIGFFNKPVVHGEYLQWAMRFTPGIGGIPKQAVEAWFYFIWNSMVEHYADYLLRIEDVKPKTIVSILKRNKLPIVSDHIDKIGMISQRYNTRPREDLSWEDIPEPYKSMVKRMGVRYGYDK